MKENKEPCPACTGTGQIDKGAPDQGIAGPGLPDNAKMALVVAQHEGQTIVIVNPAAYDDPRAFAIVLADCVHHVANAYTQIGMNPVAVAAEVKRVLLAELANPTGKPHGGPYAP